MHSIDYPRMKIHYYYNIIVLIACAPFIVGAQTVFAIRVESASVVESGNAVASGGQPVMTSDASASSEIVTVIRNDHYGSTADITITTLQNGVVVTDSRHEVLPAGGTIHVVIATSSSALGSTTSAAKSVKLNLTPLASLSDTVGLTPKSPVLTTTNPLYPKSELPKTFLVHVGLLAPSVPAFAQFFIPALWVYF
jgi:predicted amino acid-binding ACT domain protein